MRRTILTKRDVELLKRLAAAPERLTSDDRRALQGSGLDGESRDVAELEPDDYKSRLLKYIPVEVVAFFVAYDSFVRSSQPPGASAWLWVGAIAGIVGVPLYLRRACRVRKLVQYIVSCGSFAVWVFAVGGPFTSLSWYQPFYGGAMLMIYTFLTPKIDP